MKIRSLRLEHFKKFEQPVTIEGFGDGLNLITGPNETGKSTLLLALRAALFERHGSKAQAVKDFAPHRLAGARPTVTLDFEIEDKLYRIKKTFLSRADASLEKADGRRFEGAEAEAELKRLLGLDPSEKTPIDKDSPAHFGVLLTPQTRSFTQPPLADRTRHSLEAAIATEIDELGSQSEVEGLLADLRKEHFVFVDGNGKPKGRYKDIIARLETLQREIGDLQQKSDLLHQDVEALDRATNWRDELVSDEDGRALAEGLRTLENARTFAARRQALENQRLNAHGRLQQLQTARTALERRIEEKERLGKEAAEIDRGFDAAKAALAAAEQKLIERERAQIDLGESAERLIRQRRRLESLGQQIERRRDIENTLSALATEVRFDLEESALDHLTLDGQAPEGTRATVQVTEGLDIAIEGVGRISIEPKTEPMQDALDARRRVEASIADLLNELDLPGADPDAIEALFGAIAADLETLSAERTALETELAKERQETAETKASLEAMKSRKRQLQDRLGELEGGDDAADHAERLRALDEQLAEATRTLAVANDDLAKVEVEAEDDTSSLPLDRLDIDIQKLQAKIEDRRQRLDEADKAIARLESAIAVRAGLGLDEQIAELERQHHQLAQERDAFVRNHEALTLLETTLRGAADEAKATFNAPLSKRLTPYIQDLFPEATPLVTPDFSIRALNRSGMEEPFLHLSDGTREQIAVLARLAFADMLQDQGLPALVVLDDALAFSDDRRLARMLAILEEAAKRLQIILLTCREDHFAEIEATRLHIVPAPRRTSSAA